MLRPMQTDVASTTDLLIGRRRPPGSEPEQCLKRGHGLPTAIVAEHELVQVDLQLRFADAMVGPDQPLQQVAVRAIGQRDHGGHATPQCTAHGLGARHVADAGRLQQRTTEPLSVLG